MMSVFARGGDNLMVAGVSLPGWRKEMEDELSVEGNERAGYGLRSLLCHANQLGRCIGCLGYAKGLFYVRTAGHGLLFAG